MAESNAQDDGPTAWTASCQREESDFSSIKHKSLPGFLPGRLLWAVF
jgi:hypothetical protein